MSGYVTPSGMRYKKRSRRKMRGIFVSRPNDPSPEHKIDDILERARKVYRVGALSKDIPEAADSQDASRNS